MTEKNKKEAIDENIISAKPVKSFFVSMITRDITLSEAILDLLDNSVDGILRSKGQSKEPGKPFHGYFAEIEFSETQFSITDNCGGIPADLRDYALRMGRSEERGKDAAGTVGIYGIGMKRAVFKMGEHCLISTKSGKDEYKIEIEPEWMHKENEWDLHWEDDKWAETEDGTCIVIGRLHPAIASLFGKNKESFEIELEEMIATHYSIIINKGFVVKLNGKPIKAQPTKLIFNAKGRDGSKAIMPYFFKTEQDGVEVFLVVGFTNNIPSQEAASDTESVPQRKSEEAGWTIICNDRAVLYRDKTIVTGWGDGIPNYHTQFIAISGIVEFRAKDSKKLPTTTTKRGIDASSILYLKIKNKMKEGMEIFIDYTNKWKSDNKGSKEHMSRGKNLTLAELKIEAEDLKFHKTKRTVIEGEQFKPSLPMPRKVETSLRRISFSKENGDIQDVAVYLFDDGDCSPSEVGEKCFDEMLRKAQRK